MAKTKTADPLQNAMLDALRAAKVEVVTDPAPLSFISSGSLAWDIKMRGGFVRGGINNMWGPNGCGKSTLALCASAHISRNNGTVVYINSEKMFDETWAKLMGCPFGNDPDAKNFALINESMTMERTFNVMLALVGKVDFIVLDSLAELVTDAELEADMEDRGFSKSPNVISFAMKKLIYGMNPLKESQTAILITNQVRNKMAASPYEDPYYQPGGRHLEHACSNIFRMYPAKRLPDDKNKPQIGHIFQMRDTKNKVMARGDTIEIPVGAKDGIGGYLRGVELTALGKDYGLLTAEDGVTPASRGYWYFNGEKLGNGEVATWDALEARPDVAKALEDAIWTKVRGG